MEGEQPFDEKDELKIRPAVSVGAYDQSDDEKEREKKKQDTLMDGSYAQNDDEKVLREKKEDTTLMDAQGGDSKMKTDSSSEKKTLETVMESGGVVDDYKANELGRAHDSCDDEDEESIDGVRELEMRRRASEEESVVRPGVLAVRGPDYVSGRSNLNYSGSSTNMQLSSGDGLNFGKSSKSSSPIMISANLVDVSAEREREAELMRLRQQLQERDAAVMTATSMPVAMVDAQSVRQLNVDNKKEPAIASVGRKRSVYVIGALIVVVAAVAIALGVALGGGDEEEGASVCFAMPGVPIRDCECHDSCATCGYNNNPVQSTDCTSCADGSSVQAVYEDGSGICGEFSSTCYRNPDTIVENCTCHPSCARCGYSENPVKDADCRTCADGSPVKPQYLDGTGLCGRNVSQDTPCLGEAFDYHICVDTNFDACRDCPAVQHWSFDIDLNCTDLFPELCKMDDCCPECTRVAKIITECYSTIPAEYHIGDDYLEGCVIEGCTNATVPSE